MSWLARACGLVLASSRLWVMDYIWWPLRQAVSGRAFWWSAKMANLEDELPIQRAGYGSLRSLPQPSSDAKLWRELVMSSSVMVVQRPNGRTYCPDDGVPRELIIALTGYNAHPWSVRLESFQGQGRRKPSAPLSFGEQDYKCVGRGG